MAINILKQSLRSNTFRYVLRKNPFIKAHFIKLMHKIRNEHDETGGTSEASYCYSVWMRHASMIYEQLPDFRFNSVLEFGPGDTFGVGMAALMGGAKRYVAIDAQSYVRIELCRAHESKLKTMYSRKSTIPHGDNFADVRPVLKNYDFPQHILEAYGVLKESEWVDRFPAGLLSKKSLDSFQSGDGIIQYAAPCLPNELGAHVQDSSICLCLSQAVMEHVQDPQVAYTAMFEALRPGGVISHQIDFKSHGTSYDWNGHWVYSERQWSIARDRKTFRDINRLSLSDHLKLMKEAGFKIWNVKRVEMHSDLSRSELHDSFKHLTDDDIVTSGAHVIAIKP